MNAKYAKDLEGYFFLKVNSCVGWDVGNMCFFFALYENLYSTHYVSHGCKSPSQFLGLYEFSSLL